MHGRVANTPAWSKDTDGANTEADTFDALVQADLAEDSKDDDEIIPAVCKYDDSDDFDALFEKDLHEDGKDDRDLTASIKEEEEHGIGQTRLEESDNPDDIVALCCSSSHQFREIHEAAMSMIAELRNVFA